MVKSADNTNWVELQTSHKARKSSNQKGKQHKVVVVAIRVRWVLWGRVGGMGVRLLLSNNFEEWWQIQTRQSKCSHGGIDECSRHRKHMSIRLVWTLLISRLHIYIWSIKLYLFKKQKHIIQTNIGKLEIAMYRSISKSKSNPIYTSWDTFVCTHTYTYIKKDVLRDLCFV